MEVHFVHHGRRWLGCPRSDGQGNLSFHALGNRCGQLSGELCHDSPLLQELLSPNLMWFDTIPYVPNNLVSFYPIGFRQIKRPPDSIR